MLVKIVVRGHVQGVTFRHNTKLLAQELGLKGFVRNESDGSVLIIAQGGDDEIDQLVNWCRDSSPGVVRDIEVEEYKVDKKFKEFKIEY